MALRLYGLRPRVVRLDAGYWGLRLIAWIHTTLGAVAVIPWNPKRQKNRTCLPPTWTAEELGKRPASNASSGASSRSLAPSACSARRSSGWTAVETRVALTYAATLVVGLAAHQAAVPTSSAPTRSHPLSSALIRSHPLSYPCARSLLGGTAKMS